MQNGHEARRASANALTRHDEGATGANGNPLEDHEKRQADSSLAAPAAARARRRYIRLTQQDYLPRGWLSTIDDAARHARTLETVETDAARQARAELLAFIPLAWAGFRATASAEYPEVKALPAFDVVGDTSAALRWIEARELAKHRAWLAAQPPPPPPPPVVGGFFGKRA